MISAAVNFMAKELTGDAYYWLFSQLHIDTPLERLRMLSLLA